MRVGCAIIIAVMPEADRWLLAYRLLRLCGKHEGRDYAMVALLKARHTCLVMPAAHQQTSEAPSHQGACITASTSIMLGTSFTRSIFAVAAKV